VHLLVSELYIHLHDSVAFVTIIMVLYKNTGFYLWSQKRPKHVDEYSCMIKYIVSV